MLVSVIRGAAAIAVAVMLFPLGARAAEKTVVLSVENATCELCGPIVRMTLKRVPGVKTVEVTEEYDMSPPVTARVTFDDAVADVEMLIAATAYAGYPSELQAALGE